MFNNFFLHKQANEQKNPIDTIMVTHHQAYNLFQNTKVLFGWNKISVVQFEIAKTCTRAFAFILLNPVKACKGVLGQYLLSELK
jgi:hypothetical protein